MNKYLQLSCILAILTSAVFAQTQKEPVNMNDITVHSTPISRYSTDAVSTATFSNTPPQELPVVVNVLTEDFIREIAPLDLHDLLRYQPGVQTGGKTLQSRTAGQYNLRGIAGTEPMLGGTLPLPGFMGTFMDPIAFERVEIINGPVGATAGGVTTSLGAYGAGGAINLVQKQASLVENFNENEIRSILGEDTQRYRASFDVNQVGEAGTTAIRVPGLIEYGKSYWLPDDHDWRQNYFIAPAVTWSPSEDLTLGLNTTFQYTDQPGYQGIPIYEGEPWGDYDWDSYVPETDMRDIYQGATVQAFADYRVNEDFNVVAGAGMARADIQAEHLSAGAYALPGGQDSYEYSAYDRVSKTYNTFLRGVYSTETGEVDHTIVTQADWTRKESDGTGGFGTVTSKTDFSAATIRPSESRVDKVGVFLQDQLSWEQFRLLGGVRLDQHESDLGNTGESVSPRAGLSFLPTEKVVLFANLSTTEAPNFGYEKAENEELTSSWQAVQMETGFRYSPVDALWFTASVYSIDQENTPSYNDATGYYEEDGKTESEGVELSLVGDITPNWTVYAAYTYNDTDRDTDVTEVKSTPPHAVTITSSYRMTSGTLEDVVFGFGYRFRDRYDATFRGQYVGAESYIDESHVFDASASVSLERFNGPENWTVSLNIKNIFDEHYVESNRHYYQAFPGDPRVFELALRGSF
ncbi:TonB-dependent receptor [Kiritimatiellaeota bacterium B1221]|nr:TonB-dependent receptor [Kiritimatiellaeota bacterium B1221]